MSIRVRIDSVKFDGVTESLDRTFETPDEAAHLLELMAYYITRESVGAMARRFKKRERAVEPVG